MSDKILIVYKSGAKVEVKCDGVTVTKRGAEIVKVEWSKMKPAPLHIGVDEIAAIFDYGASS